MYLVGPAGFFCAGACFPGRVAYTPHLSGNGINKEFDMATHPLAGHPAPPESLINVPRLVSAYYTYQPEPTRPGQRVAFGTSGHRGSSLKQTFNEHHILAVCQAIAEMRREEGIGGPLFMGMDTHALSEAALATAIEVFAANEVTLMIDADLGYTPTPVISHAILTYNRDQARPGSRRMGWSLPHRTTHPMTAALSTTRHLAARPGPRPPNASPGAPTNCWTAAYRACAVCHSARPCRPAMFIAITTSPPT